MFMHNCFLCCYTCISFIGRAKRAPHWGVQSRFRVIYIAYYTSKSGICNSASEAKLTNRRENFKISNEKVMKISIV